MSKGFCSAQQRLSPTSAARLPLPKTPVVLSATINRWVCLKIVYPIVPNGFADHYPVFKWLFHWEYTLFSNKQIDHCSWLGISFEKVKFTPGATTYGAVLPSSSSFLWWKKLDVQDLPACAEGHQCQSQMDNNREVVRLGEAVPILVSNYQWSLVRG